MQRFLRILRSNWITATGAVVTTLSFMAFVTTFVYLALHGGAHGAYLGLFAAVLLPALFVFGIVLMPVGLLVYRAQFRARMAVLVDKPMRLLPVLGVLTLVNLATVGTAGYEAMHYMDSQQFCGTVCHTVMYPTYVTALDAPHAKIACVECHIGPGVQSFLKAKMSGLRQVASLAFDTHQRPIPTPVHTLRPANEICESCHWSGRESKDRLVVRQHFGDDAAVTPTTNVVLMKIGGTLKDGSTTGIHWHASPGTDISFVSTDGHREKIDWIRWVAPDGKERIFTANGADPTKRPAGEQRRMDCIDCHNQPGHHQQEPDAAVDEAIAAGRIARELPSIRKFALAALQKPWTQATARADILRDLEQAYGQDGGLAEAQRPLLQRSAGVVADIWLRNVHPEMKVTWGTYPNFIGHRGCMRCHDGQHEDADGESISFECSKCHSVLAEKEADPAILQKLGIEQR
ncbi:MAG TPA: cytochrome C [Planctomycetota bacterium]|nr:cytochrome C [Planctomycetota bacterium]